MKCVEARRMVTPFIKNKLNDKKKEQFLKHIEQCSDCRDELDIYFTVYKTMDMLESKERHKHNDYDFRTLLEEQLKAQHTALARRRLLRFLWYSFLAFVEILLLICMITGYELKRSEGQHSTFHKTIDRIHTEYEERFHRNVTINESMTEETEAWE